jgi:hypothetical protein
LGSSKTPQNRFFGIDVKSDLIVSSSQKIQISSTVASGIRLGIEYQSYRGLSHISNGYKPILLRSTAWESCFLKFDNMLLKFPFWAG